MRESKEETEDRMHRKAPKVRRNISKRKKKEAEQGNPNAAGELIARMREWAEEERSGLL